MTPYILADDGRTPVPVPFRAWARWFEGARDRRTVAKTEVGGARVSTVFLGLDHGFGLSPRPVLFETMVFGGDLDGEQDRYSTWDEAETGHAAMVARVQKACS